MSTTFALTLRVRGMVDGSALSKPGWDRALHAQGDTPYEAHSTSECVAGPAGARWACDGSWATSWRWKGDTHPELRVSWEPAMRSRGIRLVPHLANGSTRPTGPPPLELRVNGIRRRIEPTIDSTGVYYPFPRATKVRSLHLQWQAHPRDRTDCWLGIREIQLISL